MNDGNGHCPFKQAISTTLQSIDATQTANQSHKWAQALIDEVGQKAASSLRMEGLRIKK
ncbi:MAG: hypothetical protein NVSMB38_23690 [Ktedonobacteraceae bacterium]